MKLGRYRGLGYCSVGMHSGMLSDNGDIDMQYLLNFCFDELCDVSYMIDDQ